MSVIKKHILPVLLISTSLLLWILLWDSLPEKIPVHWDMSGEINEYGDKVSAFFVMNGSMVVAYLTYISQSKVSTKMGDETSPQSGLGIITFVIIILFLANLAVLLLATGHDFSLTNSGSIIVLMVGVLFVAIGIIMQKKTHEINARFGRFPKPISNEEVRAKTQRLGGRLFVITGVITIVMAFISPSSQHNFFGVVIIILIFAPLIYSRMLYKKIKK